MTEPERSLRVLVVGNGAREHAILWKLSQDRRPMTLFAAPGNAGVEPIATRLTPDAAAEHLHAYADLAEANAIDLTIIGPEQLLVDGIVDVFHNRGLRVFGPTAAAARLEGSKSWAKDVMQSVGIPTATSRVFANKGDARAHALTFGYRCVVKADGLALGKGSFVCRNVDDVDAALTTILGEMKFGDTKVLVEELLEGQELSVFALSDGHTVIPFGAAQDHKALREADEGPNTGGMGAYSPVEHMQVAKDFAESFFGPIVRELEARGHPFVGVLYAGAIVTTQGPKILEFNCRFGDPEAEVLLSRLDTNLSDLLLAAVNGELDRVGPISWKPQEALCVVLSSGLYPDAQDFGSLITGVDEAESRDGVLVFHGGTERNRASGELETAGGRILTVTALGDTLKEARRKAYEAVDLIAFSGKHYRHDIASKADGEVWSPFWAEFRKPPRWETHMLGLSDRIREVALELEELGALEGAHEAELREVRNRLYEIIGAFDTRAVGRIRRPPRRSVTSDHLRSLAAEFDERFRAMQRPEVLTAAQTAFDADPEEFDDIVAGRKSVKG